MNPLPNELNLLIFWLLDLKSQLNLLLVDKNFNLFKQYFKINKQVSIKETMIDKYYYNSLSNILVTQKISKYPSSVTHLTFGHWFNQPIKNNIPINVKYIKMDKYRKHYTHDLPDNSKISFLDVFC